MSEKTSRNRRIRKKLHLDEWAILGFEFSCNLAEASEQEYESFFNTFADVVIEQHLYITLNDERAAEKEAQQALLSGAAIDSKDTQRPFGV